MSDINDAIYAFKQGAQVQTDDIADGAITAAKIADGTVVAAEIAADAVTTVKILDANVTADKLATDSVTTIKIADLNVTTGKLADDAVTTAKLDESTIQYAAVALTNAEMLALRAVPKTLVAAPGAGKVIEFVSAVLLFDYTAAYTEADDNMAVKYENGAGVAVSQAIEATGFVDATADTMTTAEAKIDAIAAKTGCENKAIVLHNTGGDEFGGGNAANAVRVKVAYRVHATGF